MEFINKYKRHTIPFIASSTEPVSTHEMYLNMIMYRERRQPYRILFKLVGETVNVVIENVPNM